MLPVSHLIGKAPKLPRSSSRMMMMHRQRLLLLNATQWIISRRAHVTVQVLNLKVTVAVGMALSIPEKPTYLCNPTPEGYAVVMVDDVMDEYEELKLDHPAGEDRELTQLGEAKKGSVLWRKEHIVLPNYVSPRSPTL